MKPSFENNQL